MIPAATGDSVSSRTYKSSRYIGKLIIGHYGQLCQSDLFCSLSILRQTFISARFYSSHFILLHPTPSKTKQTSPKHREISHASIQVQPFLSSCIFSSELTSETHSGPFVLFSLPFRSTAFYTAPDYSICSPTGSNKRHPGN